MPLLDQRKAFTMREPGQRESRPRETEGARNMSSTTSAPGIVSSPVPLRDVLPWTVFAVLLLLAVYFVGIEEGAASLFSGTYVHEFVHDGRHILGFQCH